MKWRTSENYRVYNISTKYEIRKRSSEITMIECNSNCFLFHVNKRFLSCFTTVSLECRVILADISKCRFIDLDTLRTFHKIIFCLGYKIARKTSLLDLRWGLTSSC